MAGRRSNPPKNDIATTSLNQVFDLLQIDQAWSIREDHGFTWWPHRLAQTVWVDGLENVQGDPTALLRAEIDLVREVKESDELFQLLAETNVHAGLSALVWNGHRSTISYRTSAYVHEQVAGWLVKTFAEALVLQIYEAQTRAAQWAKVFGGQPAVSAHPHSGERPEPDDMLNYVGTVILPVGTAPSRFADGSLKSLARTSPAPWRNARAKSDFFAAQIPWPENPDDEPSLYFAFAEQDHATYGNGARTLLRLPFTLDADDAAMLAYELNIAESTEWTDVPQFGAWTTSPPNDGEEGHSVVFVTFLPSALYRPNLIASLSWYACGRARFARQWIASEIAREMDGGDD